MSVPYLSLSPPNFRTIFLSEKIVPNTNFASSWALSFPGVRRVGARSTCGLLVVLPPDIGRALDSMDVVVEEGEEW